MRFNHALLSLALLPCIAFGRPYAHIAPVDFTKAYLRERQAQLGPNAVVSLTDGMWSELLLRQGHLPADAYTEVTEWTDTMNTTAWAAAVASVTTERRPVPDDMALWMLQWDMGFTKARPGDDVAVANERGYGDALVAANAVKAGVEPDIFDQSISLFRNAHSTVAAKFAVAAQILRDRAAHVAPERDDLLNIRRDVLERFMSLTPEARLDDYDSHYLLDLLSSETGNHTAARTSATGEREIATPYRIARTAAAYRDRQGYLAPTCNLQGHRIEATTTADPVSGSPMCFTDAHDRAVFAWYNEAFRRQATAIRANPHHSSGVGALLALLAPFGALLDVFAAAEFTEALIADDLLEAGELSEEDAAIYEERVNALSCRAL